MREVISPLHVELARETTEISHMHFIGASSKSMACHYFISLDDKGNTGEVPQEQQINTFCSMGHWFNH